VLRSPGTNCDLESAFAFEKAGAKTERIHINALKEKKNIGRDFEILCLPGGFSFGDDIAAGKILAVQLRRYLADALHDFQSSDKLVLGICNGFQVLMGTGLLLPESAGKQATLTWNTHGQYECRWVNLCRGNSKCVFLDNVDLLTLPIAHAEGRFVTPSADKLTELAGAGHLALHYAPRNTAHFSDPLGAHLGFPDNPNGSAGNVAGVCDATGRIFGLMPHPERFIDATQHPSWTRENRETGDGMAIFENAVRYFAT
jgi:phosphoribosylformylglycinamidine synthase I